MVFSPLKNPPPTPLFDKELLRWTLNVLRTYGIRPRKKFSQNFVVCSRLVRDVIDHTRVLSKGPIMEIGTGIGTISYYLSKYFKPTIHVEIDERLGEIASKFINRPGILIIGDALDLLWNTDTIVSNTPYHISSSILVKASKSDHVKTAILVLQKDVVERLCASPGTPEYGRITVLVRLVFELEPGPVYPPSCFYPRPDVSSQLLVMRRTRDFSELPPCIEEVSRRLFITRRKKARKVICRELGLCSESLFGRLGIDDKTRIYQLTPEQIEELARVWRDSC